jgi:hypothetical protein
VGKKSGLSANIFILSRAEAKVGVWQGHAWGYDPLRTVLSEVCVESTTGSAGWIDAIALEALSF